MELVCLSLTRGALVIVSEQSSGLCAPTFAQAGSGTPGQEAGEGLAPESKQLTKD